MENNEQQVNQREVPEPTQVIPQTPPVEPKKGLKFSKKWLVLEIIILISSIMIASVIYFVARKLNFVSKPQITQTYNGAEMSINPKPAPSNPPGPAYNQISDWKTYTNSKFGYSINNPSDWEMSSSPTAATSSGILFSSKCNKNSLCSNIKIGACFTLDTQKPKYSQYIKIVNQNTTNLAGETAWQTTYPMGGGESYNPYYLYTDIIAYHNNNRYTLTSVSNMNYHPYTLGMPKNAPMLTPAASLKNSELDKIVSSFKFLPETQSPALAIYTDHKYNFSVSYPTNVLSTGKFWGGSMDNRVPTPLKSIGFDTCYANYSIFVLPSFGEQNTSSWINKYFEEHMISKNQPVDAVLGGQPAKSVFVPGAAQAAGMQKYTFVLKNNYVYVFSIWTGILPTMQDPVINNTTNQSWTYQPEVQNEYNNFMSTFKFTN